MYRKFKVESVGEIGNAVRIAGILNKKVDRDKHIAWYDALKQAGNLNPWENEPKRQDRAKWKAYLQQTDEILQKPRKQLQQELVDAVLQGDLVQELSTNFNKNKIQVFISSTFTDTVAERNALMRDVYPYLKTLCTRLGLEFDPVDMRWGVVEEVSLNHSTTELCLLEIERCLKESAGPAFLALVGNKYGYRPFPSQIESEEFTKIVQELQKQGEDGKILLEWFKEDQNALPPHYALKPREKDDKQWWEKFEKMQKLLRKAATVCLTEKDAEKYFISVTENEITHGLFRNVNANEQGIILTRDIPTCRSKEHLNRRLVDMVNNVDIDEDAQSMLAQLKDTKIESVKHDLHSLNKEYVTPSVSQVMNNVKSFCEEVCDSLTQMILRSYEENLHIIADPLFVEVLTHRSIAIAKSDVFIGRDKLIGDIVNDICCSSPKSNDIICLYGRSGCGKTSCMAKSATLVCEKVKPSTIFVVRFIGTTNHSSSSREILLSVCQQIHRAYGKDPSQVPITYKELIECFSSSLEFATEEKPLMVFLDSLDQLSNEDFGQNLKWLPHKQELPKHCKVIVSTLPGECYEILSGLKSKTSMIEIPTLQKEDGPEILKKMLQISNRRVTTDQETVVIEAFQKCPLPLYLRLVADMALDWHSYDTLDPTAFAADMPGMIHKLFERIEANHGECLVRHALAYITASNNGLSLQELEDILSCDDEVLDSIFVYFTPPLRRLPPLLWIRVRNSIGQYLVERGSDGVSTYGWYHRQFWETAEARYLGDFKQKAHLAIADYFEGKYIGGKWYTPSRQAKDRANQSLEPLFEDRHIKEQPIVIAGDSVSKRILNRRKLSELSFNLLKAEDWDRFEKLLCRFDFLEAKFAVGQGHACLSEFTEASKISGLTSIKAVTKFIGAGLAFLVRDSQSIYQMASQQVEGNYVYEMFKATPSTDMTELIEDHNRVEVEDPCQMTMTGHTSSIRTCEFSPDGKLIASTSEDSTLRVWDAFSGAEVVTVTDLPGPKKGMNTSDVGAGFRPCCFTRDGSLILTGSEGGHLQAWNIKGALVYQHDIGDAAGAVGLCTSPDGLHVATANRDTKARIFKLRSGIGFHQVAEVELGLAGLGIDYSPDGSKLAVSCYGANPSLVMIDTADHKIISAQPGHTGYNICLAYAPNGMLIATGGDNCSISLWNTATGQAVGLVKGHRGWIWCLKFSKDSTLLFSCSSDRTLKVWSTVQFTCLVDLGGHSHRVSWVSLRPGDEDIFVTGSLDMSLKIWDTKAVVANKVPPVAGLHYNLLKISPSRRYLATSQGWMTNCSFICMQTQKEAATTPAHPGFILDAVFIPGTDNLVAVDTGHKGSYEPGMAKHAYVTVTDPIKGHLADLKDLACPCRVAASGEYVFIGSTKGEIHMYTASDLKLSCKAQPFDAEIFALAVSTAKPMVAVGAGEIVKILSFEDTTKLEFSQETGIHDATLRHCAFSPRGHHLASSTYTGRIYIWNAANKFELLYNVLGHSNNIRDMQYSPTGQYLATASQEMSMRVWDVSNEYKQKVCFFGPISQCGFVDNNAVIVGLADGNRKKLSFKE